MENIYAIDNTRAFEAAARAFAANANADTRLLLNVMASQIFTTTSVAAAPVKSEPFREPGYDDFTQFRAAFDRVLSAGEIEEATCAIGYALRIYVAGEELPLPDVIETEQGTMLTYDYDSADRRRTAPHYAECFEEAARFIVDGSPVRVSNRAGVNTRGTRLVKGIGKVGVTFAVR